MRNLASPALLFLAFAVAAPGAAQIVGRNDYGPVGTANPLIGDSSLPGPGIGRQLRHIRQRIDRARESGIISRREARQLNREARLIGSLAARYGVHGLTQSERKELQARADFLRAQVNRPPRAQARARRLKAS